MHMGYVQYFQHFTTRCKVGVILQIIWVKFTDDENSEGTQLHSKEGNSALSSVGPSTTFLFEKLLTGLK